MIIDIQSLGKRYVATQVDVPEGKIAPHGIGLWAKSLRNLLTSQPQREVQALDGVSLQVRGGEIFGLLGMNGAGKTTLMKILAGLVRPTSGEAFVDGVPVSRHPAAVKRRVSYVSTTGWMGLEWQLTVRENLLLYARLFGLGSAAAAARAGGTALATDVAGLTGFAVVMLSLGVLALRAALRHAEGLGGVGGVV